MNTIILVVRDIVSTKDDKYFYLLSLVSALLYMYLKHCYKEEYSCQGMLHLITFVLFLISNHLSSIMVVVTD